jgi:hypothetical protein
VRATPATTTTTSTTIKKGGGGSGGGGSTGGGTTTTTAKGGSSSGGSSSGGRNSRGNSGGVAPGGNVDLSQFGALLGGNGKTSKSGGAVDEGTYDPELQYNGGEQAVGSPNDDNSLITIGGASVPKPSDDWVRFIGAGSLATALLVHVLWFKQQVDSIPLETITD